MNEQIALRDWDESHLEGLIQNQVEESSTLEYKACAALDKQSKGRNEISKDVSSFANSGGGTLIYGIVEKDNIPVKLDSGYDPVEITKEWLEQVIHGTIKPRIDGVHITPVPLERNSPGKIVYVVTIPQSTTAHQAADKRYYKRHNFLSAPMEDYEIKDVMNRIKYPVLIPDFSFRSSSRSPEIHQYELILVIRNTGQLRAIDFKIIIYFPSDFVLRAGVGYMERRLISSEEFSPDTPLSNQYDLEGLVIKQNSFVIFPGDEWRVTDDDRYLVYYKIDHQLYRDFLRTKSPRLYWKIFADDAPARFGDMSFDNLQEF